VSLACSSAKSVCSDRILISTVHSYRADFDFNCASMFIRAPCCSNGHCKCCMDNTRLYFHVHENGYEYNHPFIYHDLCCFPVGVDYISKVYFDRGPFDQQGCLRASGCLKGKSKAVGKESKLDSFIFISIDRLSLSPL
jgi:hypothetical protein